MREQLELFRDQREETEATRDINDAAVLQSEKLAEKALIRKEAAEKQAEAEKAITDELLKQKQIVEKEYEDAWSAVQSVIDEHKTDLDKIREKIDYLNQHPWAPGFYEEERKQALTLLYADLERLEKELAENTIGYQREVEEQEKIIIASRLQLALAAAAFRANLEKETADKAKKAREQQLEDVKEYASLALSTTSQILGSINQMFSNATQARLAELDREYGHLSQAEQAYQDFLLAKQQARYESLSDEEKEEWDLKEAAHQAEIARQEELDKKKRKLVHDEAIRNRAFAILNIILATTQAIISALASIPPNVPLSIANAAVGAAQLVAAMTVPIPPLAEGGMLTQDKIVQAHAGEVIVDIDTLTRALIPALQAQLGLGGAASLRGPVILRVGSKDINGYFEGEIDNGRILVNPRSIKKR